MKTFREFILECELVESLQPLPTEKMKRKIFRKSKKAQDIHSTIKDFGNDEYPTITSFHKKDLKKKAQQIKKMKTKMRNHDPVDSRFRELENRDRGEKR